MAGCAVGWLAAKIIDPQGRFTPLIIACCGVGNALALPLSMAQALSLNVPWIAEDDGGEGQAQLTAYVFVYTVTDSAILFGPIYFLLGSKSPTPTGHTPLPASADGDDDTYDDAEHLLEAKAAVIVAEQTRSEATGTDPSALVRMAKGLANPMLGAVSLAVGLAVRPSTRQQSGPI